MLGFPNNKHTHCRSLSTDVNTRRNTRRRRHRSSATGSQFSACSSYSNYKLSKVAMNTICCLKTNSYITQIVCTCEQYVAYMVILNGISTQTLACAICRQQVQVVRSVVSGQQRARCSALCGLSKPYQSTRERDTCKNVCETHVHLCEMKSLCNVQFVGIANIVPASSCFILALGYNAGY